MQAETDIKVTSDDLKAVVGPSGFASVFSKVAMVAAGFGGGECVYFVCTSNALASVDLDPNTGGIVGGSAQLNRCFTHWPAAVSSLSFKAPG